VTYFWQDPQGTRDPPKPLQPESRPAYVGEPLALVGIPALGPALGGLFTLPVTVVQGTVVATNHPQVVTLADGGHETLVDAILVAAQGVVPGDSGGPAIDPAGNVVGVIAGSGPGVATLTPVTDLTSLH
jgi:S1-C subfamily serine protease